MANRDNVFTFDTSPFVNGIKKIANGVGAVQRGASNMAQSISRGIVSATAKLGIFAGAIGLAKKAIDSMPEIGQAFGIAKDVFTKNLLFPLRQAVFPYLQRFLNWVRDNRAQFVKWGQVLQNVFTSVVGAVKSAISIGKELFSVFSGIIDRTFGKSVNNIDELLNVLSFKFSVVLHFLSALIKDLVTTFKPHIEIVVSLFQTIAGFVVSIGTSFLSGLVEPLKKLDGPLKKLDGAFKRVFGDPEMVKIWEKFFNFLGEVVGETLVVAFNIIAGLIDLISIGIKEIMTFFDSKAFQDFMNNDFVKFLGNSFVGGPIVGLIKSLSGEEPKEQNVNDAIVTSDGRVINLNSKDDILAFKPGGPVDNAFSASEANKVMVEIDFSGMQLIIQEANQSSAEDFAVNLVDKIREILTRELEIKGVK